MSWKPDKKFWDSRWQSRLTGWDIGEVSRPIKEYADQLTDRSIRILVPGAGNGWEVEYLYNIGFENVFILDISEWALKQFKKRVPDFPDYRMIRGDFFHHDQQYDLIFEQTFFSAIHPSQREDYARQMNRLLRPGGKLVGVIFNIPCYEDHPPYGGHISEYKPLFEKYFEIVKMEVCYNSIKPRAGNELFLNLRKKPVIRETSNRNNQ